MGKFSKKPVSSQEGGGAVPSSKKKADLSGNPEMQNIAVWLSEVKFAKKAVGGLDPVDVWNKIEELNAMYEKAIMAERIRFGVYAQQLRRKAAADRPETDASEEKDG